MHSKDASFTPSVSLTSDVQLRGLTYDTIRPPKASIGVFDKLKGLYKSMFPSLICGCEYETDSTLFPNTCERGRKWFMMGYRSIFPSIIYIKTRNLQR